MKKIFRSLAILVAWSCLYPGGSHAERPFLTEDAETVEKRAVEIELGFDQIRDHSRNRYSVSVLQIAYGLTERMEIAAGLPYIFYDPREGERVDGIGDLYAYLKYRIWEEQPLLPAFALKPFLKIPTSDESKGLGSGKTDFGLTAAFGRSFNGFDLYLDGTYLVYGDRRVTDQLSFGLAGEVEIVKSFNLVSEIRYGNNFNSSRKDDPVTLMAGFQAEWAGAVFDTGLTLGLNHAAPDYLFTVGVTLKFK